MTKLRDEAEFETFHSGHTADVQSVEVVAGMIRNMVHAS